MSGARADVFSPGPLARAHAELEGIASCTKCHAAGQQLSPEHCLDCHTELKGRVALGKGFHGRIPPAERSCEECHHEHQGADFALVDWGPGGRDRFDHARSGQALRGKHAGVPCAKCHQPRLVADPLVRAALQKQPKRVTYLGAPVACSACHFDDHRGQVGTDCQRCHSEEAWKPARRFNHARASYPLVGRHSSVACDKCHPRHIDEETAADSFPAPVSRTFLTMKPLRHASCLDCHKDPHQGRFGESCQGCHGLKGWKVLTGQGKERAFHTKTRYPLEGAHVLVACKACHGPFEGQKARYKNMAFRACTDCHADAHVGQLARLAPPAGCDRCHSVQGWLPVHYELEDHARTRYPLEGAHRAVACAHCHPRDDKMARRLPGAVRAALERKGLSPRVSPAVLASTGFERCETCHRNPHGGQFAAGGRAVPCAACHAVSAWRDLRFDHQLSRFPLSGKHARAACGSCHAAVAGGAVRYKPLETACAACHADVHVGQFARARRAATDCGRCHDAASWKAPRFVHAPPFTEYRLEGKHAPLKCDACHKVVAVGAGATARRYRPLPTACEACHADFHKGAFREFEP